MKSISLRLEDDVLLDLKKTAKIFNVDYCKLIREGIDIVLKEKHEYPLYRLISDVEDIDEKEEKEIMEELNAMSKEDLQIVEREKVKL